MHVAREIEIAEPLSRLEVLLQTWADWMRRETSTARGYPVRSCMFAGYGDSTVKDMEHSSDHWLAEAIDAIIRGLPDQEKSAICHQYLDSKYRYQIVFYAPTLHNARRLIQAGVDRRGIW
jgi:hypothetical protein